MKKILLFFAAACTLVACDPVSEDISNGGHITAEQLKSMSSVTVDKAASGQNGNVITCTTSAPVNAKWEIGGKEFYSNYAWKKMKLGDYTITLTGLCADGTELKVDYPISCQEITNPLEKYYIYGQDPEVEPALTAGSWQTMRFSATEGCWPTISDDVYNGLKTLLFEIQNADEGAQIKVMNGWWSNTYYDFGVIVPKTGELMEVPITETLAAECAKGGEGRDMTLLVIDGSVTFGAIYYEE